MIQINMIAADSDKRFVAELQEAIDEGWNPVWESFQVTAIGEPRQKIIYNILVQKEKSEG